MVKGGIMFDQNTLVYVDHKGILDMTYLLTDTVFVTFVVVSQCDQI